MKIRLADYVADFLVQHGVTDAFSVVGGGAMHLNDALGHKKGLRVIIYISNVLKEHVIIGKIYRN